MDLGNFSAYPPTMNLADLNHADLIDVNLSYVILRLADLSAANSSGTNLEHATLGTPGSAVLICTERFCPVLY